MHTGGHSPARLCFQEMGCLAASVHLLMVNTHYLQGELCIPSVDRGTYPSSAAKAATNGESGSSQDRALTQQPQVCSATTQCHLPLGVNPGQNSFSRPEGAVLPWDSVVTCCWALEATAGWPCPLAHYILHPAGHCPSKFSAQQSLGTVFWTDHVPLCPLRLVFP